jgi:L-gulonate 3-dehydrogenase
MVTESPFAVAVIGTGIIGRAWAVVFARAGHQVRLFDSDPAMLQGALPAIAESIDLLAGAGLIDDPAAAKQRIVARAALAEAVSGVGYVQENVTEDLEVKRAVFLDLDRLAPASAILASSTSAIPGSRFMDLPGRSRCIVAHPVSPPSLVPLVELVPTKWTDAEVTRAARSLLEAAGQSPVTLLKEKPGFVLNRLQSAVISEAMHLIADGVISPDDLDRTMRDGLGLRWSFMGPFETMDLNAEDGFAGYVRRYRASYATMSRDLKVHEPWADEAVAAIEADRRKLVPAAAIEDRRRWRDKELMALLQRRRKT